MKLNPYSSVSAFLAHYEALRAARDEGGTSLTPGEEQALEAMELLLRELSAADRDAVSSAQPQADAAPSAEARRRARAELKLHRLLAEYSLLSP